MRGKDRMARPEGFEPPTTWFVARYSIQLSYGRAERGIIGGPAQAVKKRTRPQAGRSAQLGRLNICEAARFCASCSPRTAGRARSRSR